MSKPAWLAWPQQPPMSMLPDLECGAEPFAVAMIWLHHRVRELMAQAFPFAGRALIEGRTARALPRDVAYETECMMQPIVHAVFMEWVGTRPQRDVHATMQEFAQFAVNCVSAVAAQSMPAHPPANDVPAKDLN